MDVSSSTTAIHPCRSYTFSAMNTLWNVTCSFYLTITLNIVSRVLKDSSFSIQFLWKKNSETMCLESPLKNFSCQTDNDLFLWLNYTLNKRIKFKNSAYHNYLNNFSLWLTEVDYLFIRFWSIFIFVWSSYSSPLSILSMHIKNIYINNHNNSN